MTKFYVEVTFCDFNGQWNYVSFPVLASSKKEAEEKALLMYADQIAELFSINVR